MEPGSSPRATQPRPRPVPRSRNRALDRVLDLLADDYAQSGRADVFDRLKVVLSGGKGAVPVAELAAELGMTEARCTQPCTG